MVTIIVGRKEKSCKISELFSPYILEGRSGVIVIFA